ncbi:unnamed protein product [Amoebophrya sp. A120]|nr:unnamed protein product [Amoebophrya sp. A120]|eukprot:GSA120T00008170001.1
MSAASSSGATSTGALPRPTTTSSSKGQRKGPSASELSLVFQKLREQLAQQPSSSSSSSKGKGKGEKQSSAKWTNTSGVKNINTKAIDIIDSGSSSYGKIGVQQVYKFLQTLDPKISPLAVRELTRQAIEEHCAALRLGPHEKGRLLREMKVTDKMLANAILRWTDNLDVRPLWSAYSAFFLFLVKVKLKHLDYHVTGYESDGQDVCECNSAVDGKFDVRPMWSALVKDPAADKLDIESVRTAFGEPISLQEAESLLTTEWNHGPPVTREEFHKLLTQGQPPITLGTKVVEVEEGE